MGLADSVQFTMRPSFSRSTSPASSSMRKCFMKPGNDMPYGSASSLTGHSPSASAARMPRRVGSASAANTESSRGSEYLTIWFSIVPCKAAVKRAAADAATGGRALDLPHCGNPYETIA